MTDSPGSGWAPTNFAAAACCAGPVEIAVDLNRSAVCAGGLPDLGVSMIVENGEARCGAGCTAMPCAHWPSYRDFSAPRLSQHDVDRIARRVVELLKETSHP